MKKYVVYREVTAIYGTIVEADSEEDAYELVDDENNKTDSENPERKWIKVNRTEKLVDDSPEEFSEKNKFHLTIDAKIKGIPVPDIDISNMSFEDIVNLSINRPLEPEEFEFFDPVFDDNSSHFDTLGEIETYMTENNIVIERNELFRHIWTIIDAGGDDSILLNGFHILNRLGYVFCRKPWGYLTNDDKDIYIEATW